MTQVAITTAAITAAAGRSRSLAAYGIVTPWPAAITTADASMCQHTAAFENSKHRHRWPETLTP
jgi:hypothetical protein